MATEQKFRPTEQAQYDEDLAAYNANVSAWAAYDAAYLAWSTYDEDQARADFNQAYADYNTAIQNWQDAQTVADEAYDTALETWKQQYGKAIPLNSYFLSRRKTEYYTHFFRNTTTSKKNLWNQYTAIVNPSDDALNGIETIIGGVITEEGSAKGFNYVIDQPFSPYTNSTDEQQNTDAIEKIVEEAIAKGEKVQHMNVVYSIDGKVMGRDMQSLSGLPTGLYIINGKKYFVK